VSTSLFGAGDSRANHRHLETGLPTLLDDDVLAGLSQLLGATGRPRPVSSAIVSLKTLVEDDQWHPSPLRIDIGKFFPACS
jgi:hypothetical protein